MQIIPNHGFFAAGDVWLVPEYRLVELPDGTHGVSQLESQRIQLGILYTLSQESGEFSQAEQEFVRDFFFNLPSYTGMHLNKATVRSLLRDLSPNRRDRIRRKPR